MLIFLTIINVIAVIAIVSKRTKLQQLAANTESDEERDAFLRSADAQIWKIVLFSIALVVNLICWIMYSGSTP